MKRHKETKKAGRDIYRLEKTGRDMKRHEETQRDLKDIRRHEKT